RAEICPRRAAPMSRFVIGQVEPCVGQVPSGEVDSTGLRLVLAYTLEQQLRRARLVLQRAVHLFGSRREVLPFATPERQRFLNERCAARHCSANGPVRLGKEQLLREGAYPGPRGASGGRPLQRERHGFEQCFEQSLLEKDEPILVARL